MNRTVRLVILFVALLPVAGAAADPVNVLLICVDDLKPLLGCYATPLVQSPNIDRLAARGTLFESAYCNQAVCSPSRNSLMTGLRPQTIGIYDLSTNFRRAVPEAVTVAQDFRQRGYRTEAVGKIFHVGHGNFEDDASWSAPHWRPRAPSYQLAASTANMRSAKTGDMRGPATECADVADDAYADGLIADEAVRRLQAARAKPDAPFFLAVGFLKPHLPFVAPQKYWDLYQRSEFHPPPDQRPPDGAPEYAPTTWGELRQYSDMPETGPLSDDQQRRLIHGYHAAVSYMDAQLGRVLDALDQTGLADKTVIVFWGDHGWHLGDHGMWCKHTNYEHAARIPLIVVAPGVAQAGAKTRSLIETVDIYPTLCELAGLGAPPGLDGASFVPVLRSPTAQTKQAAFHVFPRGRLLGRAVRTARYRLVEWKPIGASPESAELELYDLETDPAETKNRASDKPEIVAQLRAILATQDEAKPQVRDTAGKGQKTRASAAGSARPKLDRAALFAKRDANGDGRLTRDEFLRGQPDPDAAPERFLRFDVNRDGFVDRDEFISGGRPSR